MGEFDLSAYYGKVHSGDIVDNTDILEYIKSFEQVVLWARVILVAQWVNTCWKTV